ncbi:MAG: iron-sulfur cluster assembly scaffold protein [Acidobacteriota bacterium]|nr:MAG: iron-sulfur cluster assembly scaffold protein [Acidobacteriota bacterium]
MGTFYPGPVNELWRRASRIGRPAEFDSKGTAASFECGVSVRVFVLVDEKGVLSSVRYVSNGCGWSVAAAEAATRLIEGKRLRDLHALDELESDICTVLGPVPDSRESCIAIAVEAVRDALAEYRRVRAAEWKGETALICSCFGVSEETIESLSASGEAETVEDIGDLCRAGTGCGSCQILIREIILEGLR